MQFDFLKPGILAVAVTTAALFGGDAKAATLYEGTYDATSVTTNNNDHTIWLPGLFSGVNAYWQFAPGNGKLAVGASNATAHLTGRIQNNVSTSYQMDVDVSFALREENEAGDTIKQGGGKYDGTWSFMDMTAATFTGVGALDGLVLSLSAFPDPSVEDIPFQLGEGANDKNTGLGGAGWFRWFAEVSEDYVGPSPFNSVDLGSRRHGDINLNLELIPTPVPLPAAGMMLLAGLGGLGALRMRQKKS